MRSGWGRVAVGCFLLGLLLIIMTVETAGAQSYLGRFCWSLNKTEDQWGPRALQDLVQVAVVQVDSTVYLLQGTLNSGPVAVNGSAIALGEAIVVSLNWSRSDGWISTPINQFAEQSAVQIILSASNLNGTFTELMTSFYKPTQSLGQGFFAGTAVYTPCP